ncbi:rhodanese-like domain-containing protein [Desulfosporosinus fructosivorans]
MKRLVSLVIFVVVVSFLSIVGCAQVQSESENKTTYQTISTETAKERLETEKGIVLLDVRTVAENTEKRIPGSVLIPVEVIKVQAPDKLEDKNAAIFVYCRSGNRSALAAQALADMNYTNVYDLGGINKWPYETESDEK